MNYGQVEKVLGSVAGAVAKVLVLKLDSYQIYNIVLRQYLSIE